MWQETLIMHELKELDITDWELLPGESYYFTRQGSVLAV